MSNELSVQCAPPMLFGHRNPSFALHQCATDDFGRVAGKQEVIQLSDNADTGLGRPVVPNPDLLEQ
jgi:hypothetical protein